MNKLITYISIIFFLANLSYGKNTKQCDTIKTDLAKAINSYLSNGFSIFESNPVHQKYVHLIETEFKDLIKNRKILNNANKQAKIQKLFNLLYEYSDSEYEDSPDLRRVKTCRSIILSMIALISDETIFPTYIGMAKESLYELEIIEGDKIVYRIKTNMEDVYYDLLLIELLLSIEHNFNLKQYSEEIINFYKNHEKELLQFKQYDLIVNKFYNKCL